MEFYIVDCFTEGKYQGNQRAVFIVDRQISGSEMQRIAREMNFSETAFIIMSGQREDCSFNIRQAAMYQL